MPSEVSDRAMPPLNHDFTISSDSACNSGVEEIADYIASQSGLEQGDRH